MSAYVPVVEFRLPRFRTHVFLWKDSLRKEIMDKQREKRTDLNRLMKMAKEYGVDTNALFLSSLDIYMTQKQAIDMIREVFEVDDVTTTKEYVKGRENVYLHPAIKELPRHTDAINKTTSQLLDIIKVLGYKSNDRDELIDFIK